MKQSTSCFNPLNGSRIVSTRGCPGRSRAPEEEFQSPERVSHRFHARHVRGWNRSIDAFQSPERVSHRFHSMFLSSPAPVLRFQSPERVSHRFHETDTHWMKQSTSCFNPLNGSRIVSTRGCPGRSRAPEEEFQSPERVSHRFHARHVRGWNRSIDAFQSPERVSHRFHSMFLSSPAPVLRFQSPERVSHRFHQDSGEGPMSRFCVSIP